MDLSFLERWMPLTFPNALDQNLSIDKQPTVKASVPSGNDVLG